MSRLDLFNVTYDVEDVVDRMLSQLSKKPYEFFNTRSEFFNIQNPNQKSNFRVKRSNDGSSELIYFEVPGCVDKELISVKMIEEDLVIKVKPSEEDGEFFNKKEMSWSMFMPQHKNIETIQCSLKNCILKVEVQYKDTSTKVSWK
jgi:HSP20 family molecular chaperone IbpA